MSNNSSILPSKKFFLNLFILLVIAGGIVLITVLTNNNEPSEDLEIVAEPMTFDDLLTLDSNGNGIPNWEESLWGFNPFLLDTNGDGVPDAEYIRQLRERHREEGGDVIPFEDFENQTDLDLLSRQIYSTLAMVEGVAGDQEIAQQQISEVLQMHLSRPLVLSPTNPATLQRAEENSDTAIITYAENMFLILADINNGAEDILSIFETLENNQNNVSSLSDYGVLSEYYFEIHDRLKNTRVPISALSIHASLIDSIESLAKALDYITQSEDDPLLGFQSLLQIESIFILIQRDMVSFNTFFDNHSELLDNTL